MQHIELYKKLFTHMKFVCSHVSKPNIFYIAIEWPRGCRYWLHLSVRQFLVKHELSSITFHGCAFGLTTVDGDAMLLKPWRVDTSCPQIIVRLDRQCDGNHVHGQCRGSSARASASYTDEMVNAIHLAWRECVQAAKSQ